MVNTIHDEIVIANGDALTCKNFQVYYTNIEIAILVQQLELHDADYFALVAGLNQLNYLIYSPKER